MSEVKETGGSFNIQELISFVINNSSGRGIFADYFGKPEDFKTSEANVLNFVIRRELVQADGEDNEVFEMRKKLNTLRTGNNNRSVGYVGLEEKEKITPEELGRVLQLRKYTKPHESRALFIFHNKNGMFFATPVLNPENPEENYQKIMNASEGFFKVEKYDWGTEESPSILKDDGFGAIGEDTISGVSSALE